MSNFSHLHVHTQYSILDGLATIPALIKKAYADGQRAMAVTDHGNMYGIYTFMQEVEKFNQNHRDDPFKGIIGCEVYVARESRLLKRKDVKSDRSGDHLILLAKDMEGYRNLSHLVSLGWIEGEYYKPRVDKEIMRKFSKGIIACSACLGGELPQAIMRENPSLHDGTVPVNFSLNEADRIVQEFKDIYGSDYYIELQRNGHKEQLLVNEALLQLAEKHHVRCIATNDVHFVDKEDFDAHKMLICINTGKKYITGSVATDDDADNGLAYSGEEYFRTKAEMEELFSDHPEVLENTQHIVDKVSVISLKHDPTLPRFEVPAEFRETPDYRPYYEDFATPLRQIKELQFTDEFDYLGYLTWVGARKRWGNDYGPEIKERLLFELETVGKMGYPGYFLIVLDFIEAGKKNGIRFGPGRGSAAGSAIAYCLHITNIDPIKYDLLFERFLNPDRISLPDMDIDMDGSGREKTIEYVSQKYGKEKVAVIVTLMEMKGKTAIRDCARALDLPLADSDKLAKLIPEGGKVDIDTALKNIPEMKEALEHGDEKTKLTLQFARKLDGTLRGTGVHACGVIIGRDNLFDCIPLATSKNSDTMVVQYEGSLVEEAGLLKMDFLGLKTLDIITATLNNIKKRHDNKEIEIDDIPLDDEPTYKLFQDGDTTAIFQFESAGMRKYLRELKPTRFEDIIAMVALYRPGPMDNIPHFIARKHGKEKIEYPIPEMGKILDETYGITIYQEQVMLLSRLLADFTRGQADTLRKAMGKKKLKLMEELQTKFIYGGTQKDYRKEDLDKIWEEWKKFAEYAFNKSHATCYAFVSYQTAWLKANYMAEFLAANMTTEINDLKKVTELIDEATAHGIAVLPPDVNESELEFTVNKDGDIRFGLAALKGVGASAVSEIIEERERNGRFTSIFNFVERVNLRSCNRRMIESMAAVGAFDEFSGMNRAQFFAADKDGKTFTEKLIAYGNKSQNKGEQMQFSIFDDAPAGQVDPGASPDLPVCEPWSPYEQLQREREIAGFYISGHPLDQFRLIINSFTNTTLATIENKSEWWKYVNKKLTFAATVTKRQDRLTKTTNQPYGIITLEDYNTSYDWLLFSEDFSRYQHLFTPGQFLLVSVQVVERYTKKDKDKGNEKQYGLKPLNIIYLGDAFSKVCTRVRITVSIKDISDNLANIIKETVEKTQISSNKSQKNTKLTPVVFTVVAEGREFNMDLYDYQMKVDAEAFVNLFPKTLPCKLTLENN